MSGSFFSLNSKYNTLYSLYLDISGGGGGGVLQSVLDAGNTAIDIGIDLGNLDLSITSQISNSNITFEGTDLLSSSLSRDALILNTDGVEEVIIDREKLQITPTGTTNQAILSGTSLSLLDGTNVISILPTFLNMINTANGDTLNFNQGALRVERTSSGFPSYSLLQANDNACVNYTDALNSTQCVISSFGIKNSGVVNGTYIDDVSHYNRSDMKLTTNGGLLEINSDYVNFAGASSNWELNPTGLNMVDVSGNQSFIGGGNLQIQAPTGEYIGISTINGIDINGNTGSANQILAKDPSNNMTWQSLGSITTPNLSQVLTAGAVANKTIDMNGFDISGVSTIVAVPLGTNMTGQFSFDTPPHVPDPLFGTDAASKGYVDSLVGQYSGGLNLFFNYSLDISGDKVLGFLVTDAVQQIVPVTLNGTPQLIATFASVATGLTTIPAGIWNATIYGRTDQKTAHTFYYYEAYTRDASDNETLISTSTDSDQIISDDYTGSYYCNATIALPIEIDLTDRIVMKLYAKKISGSETIISTYFENAFYSFVQTSLNAGTTLLSSNNTWTGINNFSLPPQTPYQITTPANTDIVNYQQIGERVSELISEIKIVSTLQYYITTTSPYFQYPPQQPTSALIASYQYYGWYFINSVALRKISWYFAPDYNMIVSDVKGLYMNYLNITTTSNDNLPFISIYTKPTGTGDIMPGFAHSVMTYITNFSPLAGTPYCSFMNISGTEPDPFPYGHILGDMIQKPFNNPRGEYLPTEQILAIAVGTNSTSLVNQVNFIMGKVGICLEQGNQENILNPLDILLVPTLSQVLTSGSVASSQNISGVANLTATSISTPTLDNSGGVITIGANNTALTLGKLNTITNIQGNFQIAGSAGSNAQVLTSNGTTAEWITPSGGGGSWVGTATSNLNMSSFSIDASANNLSIGTLTSTGLTLGKTATTTNIQGNLQINASSGTTGQLLTSTGDSTAPTWQTQSVPNLNSVLASGSTGTDKFINITSIDGTASLTPTTISISFATNSTSLSSTTEDSSIGSSSKLSPYTLQFTKSTGLSARYGVRGITTYNAQVFDITTAAAMTLQGISSTKNQVLTADSSGKPTWQTPISTGSTAVSINIGTAFPNRTADFTLYLTGATASQIITFPTASAGNKITIFNKSADRTWTMNCAGSDLFYGNSNDPPSGVATFRNGIPAGKSFTFLQESLAYNLVNESVSTATTYIGKLYANNNANQIINLMGNQEQLFATTTPFTMPIFANTMVSTFLVCSASASVVYLQTFALLSSLVTGYVIIIRNNTLLPITIQGNAFAAVIYSTGSITSSATFTLPSTMTCSIKAISNQGYYVFSMY